MFKSQFDALFNQIILENNLIYEDEDKTLSADDVDEIKNLLQQIDQPTKEEVNNKLKEIDEYIKENDLNNGSKFSKKDWQQTISPIIKKIENEKAQKYIVNKLKQFLQVEGQIFISDETSKELSKEDYTDIKNTISTKLKKLAEQVDPNEQQIPEKIQNQMKHYLLKDFEGKSISPALAEELLNIAQEYKLVKDKDSFKEVLKAKNVTVQPPENSLEKQISNKLVSLFDKISQM